MEDANTFLSWLTESQRVSGIVASIIVSLLVITPAIIFRKFIKRMTIWVIDIMAAMVFIFFVVLGVLAGIYAEQEGGGQSGVYIFAFTVGGIFLGTMFMGFVFLILSINESLRDIKTFLVREVKTHRL